MKKLYVPNTAIHVSEIKSIRIGKVHINNFIWAKYPKARSREFIRTWTAYHILNPYICRIHYDGGIYEVQFDSKKELMKYYNTLMKQWNSLKE